MATVAKRTTTKVPKAPAVPVAPAPAPARPLDDFPKAILMEVKATDAKYQELVTNMRATIVPHNNGIPLSDYVISEIFEIDNATEKMKFSEAQLRIYLETQQTSEELILYHGTPHAMSIIENGFDVSRSSASNMFGKGVYFASLSSKSNQYAWGNMVGCPKHNRRSCTKCIRQMLICSVLMGNKFEATQANVPIPAGYHSVVGEPGKVVNPLRYPEFAVLSGDQVLPLYLVNYTIVP